MRLTVLWATTKSKSLVLCVSFTPACLASLECTLACTPACLFVNSIIALSLMVVKSLKPKFILFSKTVSFSCIHTEPLYRYCFLVFILIPCISTVILSAYRSLVPVLFSYIVISFMFTTWHAITCLLIPACYHLTPVWYHLSPTMPDTWLIIITTREW